MNLFELQERLKDFSREQLVREMQAPTGSAPQYLVLSELQRRQRMMAEEQARMQTPQTTVAEDAIAAAGVPQGGLADMARSMAPQTDMDMNTAVQPVERMQEGGSVDGRDSGFIRRLLENIRERAGKSRMTDDELAYLLGRPSFNVPEFMSPVAALRDASDLYEEGDYPGAVLNAASAFPAGRIVGPALNVYAEMYNRSGDDDVEGMRNGGVVRMQPGGLARSTGNAELDAALAELERQRIRQAEVLRSLGLQGDEEGLSGVSADVGSYRPSPISAAPMTSAGGLPNIRETQNLLGRIRPSLAQQLLEQGAPPSTEDSVDAARRRLALMDARENEGPYTEALRSDIERQRRRLTPDDYQSRGETDPLDPRSPSYVPPFDTSGAYSALLGAPSSAEAMFGDIGPLQGPMSQLPASVQDAARMMELNNIPLSTLSLPPTASEEDAARMMELNEISEGDDPSFMDRFMNSELAKIFRAGSPLGGTYDAEAAKAAEEADALPAITPAEMDEIDSMREARRILTSDEAYTLPEPQPKKDTDSGGTGVAAPAVDDAFEQDKWLALAQVGLALMSSKQPTIGGAIGEAGLSGITALRQARTDRDDRIAAQQARADRLAAAARTRAPGYEDDAVGDLLKQRELLEKEASRYFDSELGAVRPGYEERYNRILQRIDLIDSTVGAATISRFPGLIEALTEE